MLPCELETFVPRLSPAERERRLTGFTTDVARVVHWVLSHPDDYLRPRTKTIDSLCASLRRQTFPTLKTLNRIAGYVLALTQFDASRRSLTAEETEIQAAAWRVSDALHGPRTH